MWPFGLERGKQPRRSASTIESGEALARLQTAAELVGLGWSHWRPSSKDVEFDLFEALSILTLQPRGRQSFSAVPSGGAILHQSLTSVVKLLQFEQDLASGWARLQF
jgi:hypothetical protein